MKRTTYNLSFNGKELGTLVIALQVALCDREVMKKISCQQRIDALNYVNEEYMLLKRLRERLEKGPDKTLIEKLMKRNYEIGE